METQKLNYRVSVIQPETTNKLINSAVHGIHEKLIYSAGNNFSASIEPEVSLPN